MLAVADTSPINYPALLERTALLPRLYTRMVLPPAVIRELLDTEAPEAVRSWAADLPPWCEMRHPAFLSGSETLGYLGAGSRRPFSWRRIFGQVSCSPMRKMDGARR
jgi:hypothetical protein